MSKLPSGIGSVALLTLLTASQMAGAQTSNVVFGDSLSDTGTVSALSGGAMPDPNVYWQGRNSNGPNWVDRLFGANTTYGALLLDPTLRGGKTVNFSASGATSGSNEFDPVALTAAGLRTQVRDFKSFVQAGVIHPAANATAYIWMGGNDYGSFVAVPHAQAEIAAFRDQVIQNIEESARGLAAAGIRKVVLANAFDASDLAAAPSLTAEYKARSDTATALHATALADAARRIERSLPGTTVTVVDVRGLLKDMKAAPRLYGLSAEQDACLQPTGTCADPDTRLFWDDVHLASGGHQRVAAFVAATDRALSDGPARQAALASIALDLARGQGQPVRDHFAKSNSVAERFAVSASAQGGTVDRRARSGQDGYASRMKGAQIMASYRLSDLFDVGAGAGYATAQATVDTSGAVRMGHTEAMGFARFHSGGFAVITEMAGGLLNVTKSTRETGFFLLPTAVGTTSGRTWRIGGEANYTLGLGTGALTPFLRLDHTGATVDGFAENGARLLNLRYAGAHRSETLMSAGVEGAAHASVGGVGVRPFARWTMESPVGGSSATQSVTLGPYEQASARVQADDRLRHKLDGGIDVHVLDGVTAGVEASTMAGDTRGDERTIRAGLRAAF